MSEIYELKKALLQKMGEAVANNDSETAHKKADEILCEFLTVLGHDDLVELYRKVTKWYS